MGVTFVLNGQTVTAEASATTTLLDWLRLTRGLTGTKEGCNEGDCGACTVAVRGPGGPLRALNACILFLPQLQDAQVTTVEGLAGDDDGLHPVQQAMIDHHGAQCGFCTPGFIMAMAVAHAGGDRAHDDALAGNLCRCTGYAPIIRAAEAAAPVPARWGREPAQAPDPALPDRPAPKAQVCRAPRSADELAALYLAAPDATLIAGATDVGLWVTKGLKAIDNPIFLNGCADLKTITRTGDSLQIGAMVSMADVLAAVQGLHPAYAELIRRYGSPQVRAAATIGGNIANGSPIGDNAPALIALGATLHLRRGDERRDLPLESFFLSYGKQDRRPGEFVTGVILPAHAPDFRVWKISKRFDQDISAVCGAFNITVTEGIVSTARIAFGGMAGIPKRASVVEAALTGQPWALATITAALPAFAADFQPLSDMRASAAYRLTTAQNLLVRYFHDRDGAATHVLGVAP